MLAVGRRSQENRSIRGRSLSAVRDDETWPRDLDHRGLRTGAAVGRGGPDLLRWNRLRQAVRDAPPPRWAGRGPARQRRLRDGRGRHVAPRRRYRSDRPRWAGVDRILRREPHPPRLRHVVHPGDPRDTEAMRQPRGSSRAVRPKATPTTAWRSSPTPRAASRSRPRPRRRGSTARDTRCWWTRDPRRSPWWRGWSRPGDPPGPWRSPRARWRSSEPTGVVGPIQAIPSQLLDGDWLMFNRCADHETPACAEGDGGGPEGDGGGGPDGDGAGPMDRPNRRRDPARGSRGRSRRPPPRAPAVRAARPAIRSLRHRSTSPRRRDSRQPHGSDQLRCVFGSRMHRTTPTAIPCRGIGASVTGRRSRAAGPLHTRTTIPAGIP